MRMSAILIGIISATAIAEDSPLPKSLNLTATHWCPYVCQRDGGAVAKYVGEILARYNVSLNIRVVPWSRAIDQAKQGVSDGLLTVGATEAKALSYTHTPIGYYQTCFITQRNNQWSYEKPLRLDGVTLGLVQGYAYGVELNSLVEKKLDAIFMISGSNVLPRLISLLYKNRVDIIALDIREFQRILESHLMGAMRLKPVGCLTPEPYYLALNRALLGRGQLIKVLDKAFAVPANQRRLQFLLDNFLR